MPKKYLVTIFEREDCQYRTVLIDNDEELANMLLHLDKEKYEIDEVEVIIVDDMNYKEFFKKENLEFGKEKNND